MLDFLKKMVGREPDGASEEERSSTRRLQRRLSSNAQTLSLRRLKKVGLQSVRVLDANALQEVVNASVDEALRHRAADLSPREREEVQDFAAAQLKDLMQANEQLSAEKQEAELQRLQLTGEVDGLRQELARLTQTFEAVRQGGVPAAPVAAAPEGTAELAWALGEGAREGADTPFAGLFEGLDERVRSIVQRLARDQELLALVEAELARPGAWRQRTAWKPSADGDEPVARVGGAAAPDSEQLSNLERRIKKLQAALTEKEEALKRVIAMKAIDPGLASIYDDIQGLDLDDPLFQRKGALLEEVFKQNLELQGHKDAAEPSAFETDDGPRRLAEPTPPLELDFSALGFSECEAGTAETSF